MKKIKEIGLKALFLIMGLLANLSLLFAQAPASSKSVYSDQNFDPASTEYWYDSPLFWAGGMVLVGAVIIMLVRKNRKYT